MSNKIPLSLVFATTLILTVLQCKIDVTDLIAPKKSVIPVTSLSINNDDESTNSEFVQLTISIDNQNDTDDNYTMCISNNKDLNDGIWEKYQSDKAWTLSAGNGIKSVYIKVKNKAGIISATAEDSIFVDNTIPAKPVITEATPNYTNNNRPEWHWKTGGNGCGIFRYNLDDSDLDTRAIETDKLFYRVLDPVKDGAYTLYIQERNKYGIWSEKNSATINVDTAGPSQFSVSINKGACFTNSENIQLTLGMEDEGCDNSLCKIYITYSNTLTGGNWETFSPSRDWVLPTDDGIKTIYVWFADIAGNISGPASAYIELDKLPPVSGCLTINSGATITRERAVTLQITPATDKNGIKQIHIANYCTNFSEQTQIPYSPIITWTLSLLNGINSVYVWYEDNAGNRSLPAVARIIYDNVPPQIDNIQINKKTITLDGNNGEYCTNNSSTQEFKFEIKIKDNLSVNAKTVYISRVNAKPENIFWYCTNPYSNENPFTLLEQNKNVSFNPTVSFPFNLQGDFFLWCEDYAGNCSKTIRLRVFYDQNCQ